MRHPLACLLALASLALTVRPAVAQADPDAPTRALLVGHGGLLNFNGFRGAGFAVKRTRGDRALRLGLSVGLTSQTFDETQTAETSPQPQTSGEATDGDQSNLGVGVFAQVERTRSGRGPLRPYAFAGPFFDVSRFREHSVERRTVQDPQTTSPYRSSVEQSRTVADVRGGLGGGVGVEWRLTSAIGALIECGGSLSLFRRVNRVGFEDRDEPVDRPAAIRTTFVRRVDRGGDLRTEGVTAGVALYF